MGGVSSYEYIPCCEERGFHRKGRRRFTRDLPARTEQAIHPAFHVPGMKHSSVKDISSYSLADAPIRRPDKFPLHVAAKDANIREVDFKTLIDDCNHHISLGDEFGRTPLHFAAWTGNMIALRLLVNEHAQLDAITKDGRTALDVGADANQGDVVHYLMIHARGMSELDIYQWKQQLKVPDQASLGRHRASIVLYNRLEHREKSDDSSTASSPSSINSPRHFSPRGNRCSPVLVKDNVSALKTRSK